jgi:biopolymer transport protein TolR
MQSYRQRKRRLMSEINVVPYIDVMLVLLVIFMITAPLLTEGVRVELPRASAEPVDPRDQEPVVITVDKEGRYYLPERDQPSDLDAIVSYAAALLRRRPEADFLVRGDREARYDGVVQAMVALQQAGVEKIGLITRQPDGQ